MTHDSENPENLPRHLRSDFELRTALLEEALDFVRAARSVEGVLRIALVGSLTTAKKKPKDCDLLVSLTDDLDLGRIAKLGRRLKGRTGGMGSGADVFLCDEEHHYIGRVCHWKECWPRVRCQARHCGERPGLYDDLDVVHLGEAITQEPPVELYPEILLRAEVPPDVKSALLQPLEQDQD